MPSLGLQLKQLAKVVCEQRQFNLVLVYVVKNGDVFANNGDCLILRGFIDELRVFDKNEIIVQNVHHRIALIVQIIQVRDALNHWRDCAQAIRRVSLKHAKTNVGAQPVRQF